MEYEDAGDFTSENKFKRSIKINLKWYLVFSLVAGPLLAITYYSGALESIEFTDFLSALSNTFGMMIVIVCLGYSLTSFP